MTAAAVAYERHAKFVEEYGARDELDMQQMLIEPLRQAANPDPDLGFEHFEGGLEYAAEYLTHLAAGGTALFPGIDRIDELPLWRRADVAFVLDELRGQAVLNLVKNLNEPLRPATVDLIAAALLAVNGIHRRSLLEALLVAKVNDVAADVFGHIAVRAIEIETSARKRHDRRSGELRWVAEHAVFCMGFMASVSSVDLLLDIGAPLTGRNPDEDRAVRMTALMSLGDLAHALKDQDVRRDQIADRMVRALEAVSPGMLPLTTSEMRGALYTLAMLRPIDDVRVKKVLLRAVAGELPSWHDREHESRATHADETSKRLARWALLRIDAREQAKATPEGQVLEGWLISPIDPRVLGDAPLLRRSGDPIGSGQPGPT